MRHLLGLSAQEDPGSSWPLPKLVLGGSPTAEEAVPECPGKPEHNRPDHEEGDEPTDETHSVRTLTSMACALQGQRQLLLDHPRCRVESNATPVAYSVLARECRHLLTDRLRVLSPEVGTTVSI